MKTIRFIFSGIALITALTFSGQLSAQDKITLTWQAEGEKVLSICISGGSLTIDWGDGTPITTISNQGGGCLGPAHTYAFAGEYTVTIAAKDNNCRVTSFDCTDNEFDHNPVNNQVTALFLTNCSALTSLRCFYNNITELDLTDCTALSGLSCYNNQLTVLNIIGCSSLISLNCANNQLTNIDLTNCSILSSLTCGNNQLTELDLSGCLNLQDLYCFENQLTSIDFGEISALKPIYCYNNRLQLSDLYKIQSLVNSQYGKLLGTQNLHPQTVDIGTELFAEQSVFDGIFTEYTVTKNGNPAPKSDYSINDGKITFNNVGIYIVTMANNAIISSPKAEAIIELNVGGVSGISDISLFNISVYPNPAKDIISIQSSSTIEQVSIYDISGKLLNQQNNVQESISISDLANGIYLVKIKTEEGETVRKIIKN